MLRTPLIVCNSYQGEEDPGGPLTDEELNAYCQEVDALASLWSNLVELATADAFTLDEWVDLVGKVLARSEALKPYQDRIAKELDDQFDGSDTARVIAQYNLGKKFIEKKKVTPRDNSLLGYVNRYYQQKEAHQTYRKKSRPTDREES